MGALGRLKATTMERSRRRKLDEFYALCATECDVLDVGVSDYDDFSDQTNMFMKSFRFPSSRYTGLAVDPMDQVAANYPDKRFVTYDGTTFPFRDGEFGWVFSNAVIEHVGDERAQLRFIDEMFRVAEHGVYFTTPNKWFPVESHTNTLFRHWFDRHFYAWCERQGPYWREENLKLLSRRRLRRLLERSAVESFEIRANRTVGWPMTYSVVCRPTRN